MEGRPVGGSACCSCSGPPTRSATRVGATLEASFGGATFADRRLPLHVAATDYETGAKVTLEAGRAADAVRVTGRARRQLTGS